MLLFKELKTGSQVFRLDRVTLEYSEGVVCNVGMPYAPPTGAKLAQPMLNLMVDVVIDFGGNKQTFVIPDTHSVTAVGEVILSTEKDGILNEVRAIKSQSEQVLNAIDKHKEKVSKCNVLIADLDSAFRERQEIEARFGSIESKMDLMASRFDEFLKKME